LLSCAKYKNNEMNAFHTETNREFRHSHLKDPR
jgi:hypothetical protein